jgi:hypothetical protein
MSHVPQWAVDEFLAQTLGFGIRWKCTYCDKSFRQWPQALAHETTHLAPRLQACTKIARWWKTCVRRANKRNHRRQELGARVVQEWWQRVVERVFVVV